MDAQQLSGGITSGASVQANISPTPVQYLNRVVSSSGASSGASSGVGSGTGASTSYISDGSSAKTVADSLLTFVDSFSQQFSNISSLLSGIQSASRANTAASQAMAREQMAFQKEQNKIAMDFNMAEALKNREWQEMMSNTAHQREVADLQAAGLNPVLSATGGNGAAVTSGATASGVTSSGASGQVDTSMSAALVQLLSVLVNSAASMHNANVSAKTNLESARLAADASRYGTDVTSADRKWQRELDRDIFEASNTQKYISSILGMFNFGFGSHSSTNYSTWF